MAKELPYFRWYPKDAESDEKYAAMDDTELGFFHRCLNKSWTNEGLPADPEERARVLKTPLDVANEHWKRVGKSFQASTQFSGKLINPRQEIERHRATNTSQKAQNSANARHGKKSPIDGETQSETSANVVRTHGERSAPESLQGEDWFEEVYRRHPKKKDRGLAAMNLSQITVDRKEFDRVHLLWCEEWAKDKPQFAPSLAQWIMDQGWRYPPANGNGNGHALKYQKPPGIVTNEVFEKLKRDREERKNQ